MHSGARWRGSERIRFWPTRFCVDPNVRVEALAVAVADRGSDLGAAERIGAARGDNDANRQHARRTRPGVPPGCVASRRHGGQRDGLHRWLALVRCRVGFQPGLDIRALPVDGVPQSTDRDPQLRRDAGRACDHLLGQQLLGRLLSEPALVEQQELLGRSPAHLATSTLAPAGSSPAAAGTAPADHTTGSAVDRSAAQREASIGWQASAIGHPTAFHGAAPFGWTATVEHSSSFRRQAAARHHSIHPGKWLVLLEGREHGTPRITADWPRLDQHRQKQRALDESYIGCSDRLTEVQLKRKEQLASGERTNVAVRGQWR